MSNIYFLTHQNDMNLLVLNIAWYIYLSINNSICLICNNVTISSIVLKAYKPYYGHCKWKRETQIYLNMQIDVSVGNKKWKSSSSEND